MNRDELIQYLSSRVGLSPSLLSEMMDRDNKNMYRIYSIKQGKKIRQIEEPEAYLKSVQEALLPILEEFSLADSCICRKGHGIADNEVIHQGAQNVLKIDISKCYQNVCLAHVDSAFDGKALIDIPSLGSLCFLINRNGIHYLPTGAPTSPILCNIALTPIDREIEKLLSEDMWNGIKYRYTRYIDDLIISTAVNGRHWHLLDKIGTILNSYSLKVNQKKSKWLTVGNDKITATGINLVSGGAPREMKREVREVLYYLALQNKDIDEVTQGKLAHIRNIDKGAYQGLMRYYDKQRRKNR